MLSKVTKSELLVPRNGQFEMKTASLSVLASTRVSLPEKLKLIVFVKWNMYLDYIKDFFEKTEMSMNRGKGGGRKKEGYICNIVC